MWNWLQPYVDPKPPADPNDPVRPLYNALQVGKESGTLRNDPAPYTFLEGVLATCAAADWRQSEFCSGSRGIVEARGY
jgi:hypothetical protein